MLPSRYSTFVPSVLQIYKCVPNSVGVPYSNSTDVRHESTIMLNIASLLSVFTLANAYSQLHQTIPTTYPDLTNCSTETLQYSCENTTVVLDSCCSVIRGGLVLQTQFWSTWTGLEEEGQLLPKGSWTIHGLWPDNCDGCIYRIYCLYLLLTHILGRSSHTAIFPGSMIQHRLPPLFLTERKCHLTWDLAWTSL